MNKIKHFFKVFLKKVTSKKFLYAFSLVLIGIVIGLVIGSQVFKKTPKKQLQTTQTASDQNITKNRSASLKKTYDRNKSIIADDLKAKKITDKQAKDITKKLDEAYAYKKSILADEDPDDELQIKRDDLRKWADDNKISKKYFLGIL